MQVAAPVFQQVMTQALRLMNISPDDLPAIRRVASADKRGIL